MMKLKKTGLTLKLRQLDGCASHSTYQNVTSICQCITKPSRAGRSKSFSAWGTFRSRQGQQPGVKSTKQLRQRVSRKLLQPRPRQSSYWNKKRLRRPSRQQQQQQCRMSRAGRHSLEPRQPRPPNCSLSRELVRILQTCISSSSSRCLKLRQAGLSRAAPLRAGQPLKLSVMSSMRSSNGPMLRYFAPFVYSLLGSSILLPAKSFAQSISSISGCMVLLETIQRCMEQQWDCLICNLPHRSGISAALTCLIAYISMGPCFKNEHQSVPSNAAGKQSWKWSRLNTHARMASCRPRCKPLSAMLP